MARVSAQDAPDHIEIGIRLLDAPTERRDDPRAHRYIVDHVQPGATLSRRIEVSSTSTSPVTVSLYGAGASIEDGQFVVGAAGEGSVGSWVTVVPDEVTLQPGGRHQASVTIAVPAGAERGEHYGAAMAEVAPGTAGPGAVAIGARVGIRVYLSVGQGGEPRSDFVVSSLTASREADGTPVVSAAVENTGGRALDMTGELRLTDGPGGVTAGPFAASLGTTLAPGQRAPVRIGLDEQIPAGPWRARLTLRSGRIEREAEATISFPRERGASAAPVEVRAVTGTTRGRVGLAVAAGLLALVVPAVAFRLFRRRGA